MGQLYMDLIRFCHQRDAGNIHFSNYLQHNIWMDFEVVSELGRDEILHNRLSGCWHEALAHPIFRGGNIHTRKR